MMYSKIVISVIVFSLIMPSSVAAFSDEQTSSMESIYADKATNVRKKQERVNELSGRLSALEQKTNAAKTELSSLTKKQQETLDRLGIVQELSSSLSSQRSALTLQQTALAQASSKIVAEFLPLIKNNDLAQIDPSLRPKMIAGLRLSLMKKEADRIDLRLSSMAVALDTELHALELSSVELSERKEEVTTVVDTNWKKAVLTEEQLKEVKEEDSAVLGELAQMRSHLLDISSKLKREKVKELTSAVREKEAVVEDLKSKREAILARREASEAVRDDLLRAENALVQDRNIDQKQFKRIEDAKEELQLLKREYEKLANLSSYEREALAAMSDAEQAERLERVREMQLRIAYLEEKLVLLERGVPEDVAEDYFVKRKAQALVTNEDATFTLALADIETAMKDAGNELLRLSDELENARHTELILEKIVPQFLWPVIGYITAGFHDEDYRHVFGVAHQAIDIATPQGTAVKAVADGIVYKVKNGGAKGYSYILIGHRDGYASLYGHMNVIGVNVGDTIRQGQTIGRSGGQPGTVGAGRMTTGSHLHLEILKDGVHIDPRSILPKR